jgi:4-amino-4-deoxy-L-arabinose transferase-like glycosyltransferase
VLFLGDSETYLAPAVDLEQGGGFDLVLKRTPGYPLLIAASLTLFGDNLHALGMVQHFLGLVTAALAFFIAARIAGLPAGLLAGLATAIAGNLLIYERLIMSETLFTTLLLAAVAGLVVVRDRPRFSWLLLAGAAIGSAALVRPVAQVLLLLAPATLLLAGCAWRGLLVGLLSVLLGYGLIIGPWALRGALSPDGVSIGALGQTLVGRTARHDRRDPARDSGFVFLDPASDRINPQPTDMVARGILQEAADRGSSGRAVHTRLKRELGLSDAQADRLMRDLALEAILRRADYYLSGSAVRFVRLWNTPVERLGPTWNEQAAVRREWEHTPSAFLLDEAGSVTDDGRSQAETLTRLFQPAYLGWALLGFFALGMLVGLTNRRHRAVLVPASATVLLLGLSAALVGGVSRYRYPADPLIFVVIAVGVVTVGSTLVGVVTDRPRAPRSSASS